MSPEVNPKWKLINGWKAHKYKTVSRKVRGRTLEYNRISRLEVYRYFKNEDVQKFVDFLHKEFEVLSPDGQPLSEQARFVMGLDGKTTVAVRKGRRKTIKLVTWNEFVNYFLSGNKPVYKHHCFLIRRRKNLYTVRMYKVLNLGKDYFKVEIGYYASPKKLKNLGPKENHRKNTEKIKALQEIMKSIDTVAPYFRVKDYTRHGVNLECIVRRSEKYKPEAQRKEEAEERRAQNYQKSWHIDTDTGKWLFG